MENEVILIDANSLGFAATASNKHKRQKEKGVNTITGFLSIVQSICKYNPKAKLLFFWDGDSWRKGVYEGYKGNRKENAKLLELRDQYVTQLPDLKKALSLIGADQFRADNMEADDLIAKASWRLHDARIRSMIISSDKDLMQLVTSIVSWRDPIHLKFCDRVSFAKMSGLSSPTKFVDFKALVGDQSDNVSGIPRIGGKTAIALLTKFHDVESLIKQYQTGGAKVLDVFDTRALNAIQAFLEDKQLIENYRLNFKVMSLLRHKNLIPKPVGYGRIEVEKNYGEFMRFAMKKRLAFILGERSWWKNKFFS